LVAVMMVVVVVVLLLLFVRGDASCKAQRLGPLDQTTNHSGAQNRNCSQQNLLIPRP
jgi:hypothetical protein